MNNVNLIGNIATDIELREVGSTVVTSINLAVRDDFKRDTTHFLRVEVWDKNAENLNKYCAKGSKIAVVGSLKVDKFKDKEGNNREVTKVNASRVEFLDSKGSNIGNGGQQSQGRPNTNQAQQTRSNVPDENPFANDIQSSDLPF